MILLDTNVISELMKPAPSEKVTAWVDCQQTCDLFITSITVAEINYGLNAIENGKRRQSLEQRFERAILEAFKSRILSFDEPAAFLYGEIMSYRKMLGRPMSILDGQICSIAKLHDATIATRNIRDFTDCDVELVNPFVV